MKRNALRIIAVMIAVVMAAAVPVLAAGNYYIAMEFTGPDKDGVTRTFYTESDYNGTLNTPLTAQVAGILLENLDELGGAYSVPELKPIAREGLLAYLSPGASDWSGFVNKYIGSVSGSGRDVLANRNSRYGDLTVGVPNVMTYAAANGTYTLTVTLRESPQLVPSVPSVSPGPSGSLFPTVPDIPNILDLNGLPTYYGQPMTVTPAGFSDVSPDDWFWEGVNLIASAGLMQGVSQNLFAPYVTTTRAMIVTILYRLENLPAVLGVNPYTDVAPGAYYDNPVNWATTNGIVTGYGDGRFGPDDPITREQLAAILYRYAVYKEYRTGVSGDLSAYADASKVSGYAVTALTWAVQSGIINGMTPQTLEPQGNATRAQAATILTRFILNYRVYL